MAIDPQPCESGGEIDSVTGIAPVVVEPETGDVVVSIAPGTNGQFLGTVGGSVQWAVPPGGGGGAVNEVVAIAPLEVDTPIGDVTISVTPGTNGDVLVTEGGVVDWSGDITESLTDLQTAVGDLDTNKAPNTRRYWSGTGGVGTWGARPSLVSPMHSDAYSLLDPEAPPPPDAVAGDTWDRHPDAVDP